MQSDNVDYQSEIPNDDEFPPKAGHCFFYGLLIWMGALVLPLCIALSWKGVLLSPAWKYVAGGLEILLFFFWLSCKISRGFRHFWNNYDRQP